MRRICWTKEKTSSEKEITTEKEKRYRIAQLIKQLGNPQRLVWGEIDGGMWLSRDYTSYQGSQKYDGIQEKKPRN